MIATPIQTMAPGPPAATPSAGAGAPAAQASGLPSFARTLAQAVTDQQTNADAGAGTPVPDQGGKPPADHTDDAATLQGLAALSVLLSSLQTAPLPQQGGPAPAAQPSATAAIAAAPAGAAPIVPAVAVAVPRAPTAAIAAGAAAQAEPKPPVAPTPTGATSPAPVAAKAALSPPTPAQAPAVPARVPSVAPAGTTPAPAPPTASVPPTASAPARLVDEFQRKDLVTISAGQVAQSRPSTHAARPSGPPVPEQPQGRQPGQPMIVPPTPAEPLTTAAADTQSGAANPPSLDNQPGQLPVPRPAPDAAAPPKPSPAPDPGQTAAVPVALAAKAPPGPRRQETQSPASAAHQAPASSPVAQPPATDATLTPLLQAHPSNSGALPAEVPGASQPQPVRAEEIIAQVAHQLKLQQVGAHSHLQLQLHPEHLGQLTLRLSMAAGGALHGSVTVAQGALKAALDGALTELNQVLLEKGVKVSSLTVNVSSQGGQSQGQAAMRDEQRSRQHLAGQQRVPAVARSLIPAPALALAGSGRRFNALA